MKGVYKFKQDCGRMGCLRGLFVANIEEVAANLGKEAYFDEPLGKHSEVSVILSTENVILVTDKPDVVALVEEHDLTSGFNPFDYLVNTESDDDDD